jgi:catechol 2,3-dioxygenase-like lactoylglutathione lyase family enzyme
LLRGATMLAVGDVERSLRFYRDIVGFEQLAYPHVPLLALGNLQIFLVGHSPPTDDRPGITLAPNDAPASSPVNLVIEVDNAHTAYEALRTRGVAFLAPPMRPPWGGWRCFATDPDGYVLEIEQPS